MIKNLPRQLNEAGKIKIGKKGNMITSANKKEFRPPKKLDHFQLVTTEKDVNGDYIVDIALQNKIKESGNGIVNKEGCLVGLPIRLLYNDTELNFPHRYVSYVSGKMSCHGDGEKSWKRVDNFQQEHKCPCDRVAQEYQGQDKCKPTGTLTCIIDEAGLFGQAHKFRTTSMNTIKGILGGIELIKTATNGKIAGLPLMLTMNAKQTTTPQGIATTVYIVSICYRGSMNDLRSEVLQLMSTEKQYLLSMETIEADAKQNGVVEIVNDEEEREFVEEFFPDAVTVENDQALEVKTDSSLQTAPPKKEIGDLPGEAEGPELDLEDHESNTEEFEIKGVLEPVGAYRKIYENFLDEKDLDKAMAYANRLQKGNMLFWMANVHKEVEFEYNIKKPELLEIIRELLSVDLASNTVNGSETEQNPTNGQGNGVQPGQELWEDEDIPEALEEPVNLEPKAETIPREWDKSGSIQKDQLRELVRLKTTLEKQGVLQPDKWELQVNYFLDEKGNKISRATNLTKTQGENLIMVLERSVQKDIAV